MRINHDQVVDLRGFTEHRRTADRFLFEISLVKLIILTRDQISSFLTFSFIDEDQLHSVFL